MPTDNFEFCQKLMQKNFTAIFVVVSNVNLSECSYAWKLHITNMYM